MRNTGILEKVSHIILFWIAFVLTRPFGATFGDLLTKSKEKGGLELGTLRASAVIFALFIISFAFEMYYLHKDRKNNALKTVEDPVKIDVDVDGSAIGVGQNPTSKADDDAKVELIQRSPRVMT